MPMLSGDTKIYEKEWFAVFVIRYCSLFLKIMFTNHIHENYFYDYYICNQSLGIVTGNG